MHQPHRPQSWVVYQVSFDRNATLMNVVCDKTEWDSLERDRPGDHTLLKSGIPTEAEADRYARSLAFPGETPGRGSRRAAHLPLLHKAKLADQVDGLAAGAVQGVELAEVRDV